MAFDGLAIMPTVMVRSALGSSPSGRHALSLQSISGLPSIRRGELAVISGARRRRGSDSYGSTPTRPEVLWGSRRLHWGGVGTIAVNRAPGNRACSSWRRVRGRDLSVMIQVLYFKWAGKRISAWPAHHHMSWRGEGSQVVVRF